MNPSPCYAFRQVSSFYRKTLNGVYAAFPIDRTNPVVSRYGCLSVAPLDSVETVGVQGGPFAPSTLGFTLRNSGGSTLNFVISNTTTWLDLDIAGGELEPGESVTVIATVDADSIAAGTYSGSLDFGNITNNCGDCSADFSLIVTPYVPPTPDTYPINNAIISGDSILTTLSVPSLAGYSSTVYTWEYSIDNSVSWHPVSALVMVTTSFENLVIDPSVDRAANLSGYKFRLTVEDNFGNDLVSGTGTVVQPKITITTPALTAHCMSGNPIVKSSHIVCNVNAPWLGTSLPGVTFQWQIAPADTMVWADMHNGDNAVISGVTTNDLGISSIVYPYANDAQNGGQVIHYFRCQVTYTALVGASPTDYMKHNCPPPP